MAAQVLAAIFDLSQKTTVLKTGWFEITLANLAMFVLVIGVFIAGLAISLPGRRARDEG